VDVSVWELTAGDVFLLCSDGLHSYIKLEEIPMLMDEGGHFAVDRFLEVANARGGKDNITAVIVEVC
jgi:protein phosphatase